jgi:SAM-dependent methyltransferase
MSVLGPDIPDSIDSKFAGLVDSSRSGWFQQDSHEFFKGFAVSAEDILLDVGCGEGAATLFCAERGAHVIFSDINPDVVARVEEKVKQQALAREYQAIVCDSNPLPVPDACASRIVCMEVLEHVDDPGSVLSELVRAGKPGALYLITVPGERGEKIQQNFAPASYFEKPNHIRIFDSQSFQALVEDSGLVLESFSETGFFWVMWMSLHWAVEGEKRRAAGGGETELREIEPPFDDALDRWAALWVKFTGTPEGLAFKHEMDKLLPKHQVIVARKPGPFSE